MTNPLILMILPGHLFKWNEFGFDDLVVFATGSDPKYPIMVRYKSTNVDVARFQTRNELYDWLQEHLLHPANLKNAYYPSIASNTDNYDNN